jgi:nucleotide-binding universal stress UspA family protein
MYKSVLVATDGSDTASEAVKVATELAQTFGATLHILSVTSDRGPELRVPDMHHTYPEGIDRRSMAETHTEASASRARTKGLTAQTYVVTGDVAERIVEIAEEQQVELIVVGNKGMRGIRRVLGSVPNAVAQKAPCAVLIVNTT